MNRRILAGCFEREEDLLHATEAARLRGWRIIDVYTPYPVHGLDRAMGLAPSRLGIIAFVLGALGTFVAFALQYWTSAIDWPINIGGRPWNSLPAFVPVAFEVMVLFAGFGVVFAFLCRSRLFPGRKETTVLPGVTDNRFVLLLEETDAAFDVDKVRTLFRDFQAVKVEEWEESEGLR